MNKQVMLKKVEDIIKDKELDEDMKIMLISAMIRVCKKSSRKAVK